MPLNPLISVSTPLWPLLAYGADHAKYKGFSFLRLGKVSRKKVTVLLDFVQITSTPPLTLILTTCTTFFERQCAKKFGQGSPHPQIDPIYSL